MEPFTHLSTKERSPSELKVKKMLKPVTKTLLPIHNHSMAIEELNRGRELTSQLRALLSVMNLANEKVETAGVLFEEVLKSFTLALSVLVPCEKKPDSGPVASGACLPTINGGKEPGWKRIQMEESRGDKGHRRRRCAASWATITSMPLADGYQWRKYGQKKIHGAKYHRSYYKCIHGKDQGCQATKQVQQKDDGSPPMFFVIYQMPHTCKNLDVTSKVGAGSSLASSTSAPDYGSKSLDVQPQQHLPSENLKMEEPEKCLFTDMANKSQVLPITYSPMTLNDMNLMMDMIELDGRYISNEELPQIPYQSDEIGTTSKLEWKQHDQEAFHHLYA